MKKLLELTEQEKGVVEERLGTTVAQATEVLLEAQEWARENTTPQEFEYHFPEFVSAHCLSPAVADVAANFVLTLTQSEDELEIDERGFELLLSRKPPEIWNETDQQTWAAFMESCRKDTKLTPSFM